MILPAASSVVSLAEKTQRSVSLLSQIETGNVSPSFSSMQTIADALKVPLAQIISQEPAAEGGEIYHISESERKVLITQGGGPASAFIARPAPFF